MSLSSEPESLVAAIHMAHHAAVYLTRSLPAGLLMALSEVCTGLGAGSVEVVVEGISEVEYLRSLHSSGMTLFYGVGLPQGAVIVLDRKQVFRVVPQTTSAAWRCRALGQREDIYMGLLWHRFGSAVSVVGEVSDRDGAAGYYCIRIDGNRDQWCRFRNPDAHELSPLGAKIEVFGWEKWNTRIIDALAVSVIPPCGGR